MLLACRRLSVAFALLASAAAADGGQDVAPSRAGVQGRVVDAADHRLPGTEIVLVRWTGDVAVEAAPVVARTAADGRGEFRFSSVAAGTYVVVARLAGYEPFAHTPFHVTGNRTITLDVTLRVAPVTEEVRIVGSVEEDTPSAKEEFGTNLLSLFPLPTDRFQEVLPQLPGVVRDPRGRISFNGTRPSQSTLLVNGTTATDPVTGEFAVELPLKAVDTVEVFTIPYSAEFGRVTGAVANVRTRAGDDHWDIDVGNLWPSPRVRDGQIRGINSATPRVQVSGPLVPGRAWIAQGVSYRFVRSRVYDVAPGEIVDEEILESFDGFTQADVALGPHHTMTATFSFFPVETDNLGIDTLHPQPATPHFESGGWNFGLADRYIASANTLWETTFALRRFSVTTERRGTGPARLTVDGLGNNYFNEIDRQSTQVEFNLSRLHFISSAVGPHQMKIGGNLYSTQFDGTDRSYPIELVDGLGRPYGRITFEGLGRISASDVALGVYVQDQWRPTSNLAVDLGVRYDYERITDAQHLAPRFAFAYSPTGDGQTIVKGGWGLFFDQVFLHAGSFEQFQRRTETRIDPSDGRLLDTTTFANRLAPEGLHVPRSKTWNLELNRQLGPDWMLRVNYRERRASRQLMVERLTVGSATPALRLSSSGHGLVREFDTTIRRRLPGDAALFVAFSKRRTTGELNDFGTVYGNLREPLLLDAGEALQPFDVPNRFLLWGTINLPNDIVLVPALEWRSGFPYTIFDERYEVVGERNGGGRFPAFLSADVRVTKAVDLFGRRVRLGVELLNLTDHVNPRDVVNNIGSSSFGTFRNSVDRSIRLRLELSL